MEFIQGPPSDPFDSRGVGRELFDKQDAERRRLAEWYAEARGVLESFLSSNSHFDQGLARRVRACLDRKPILDEGSEV